MGGRPLGAELSAQVKLEQKGNPVRRPERQRTRELDGSKDRRERLEA